jgi:LytS/YehU family sensor histidine kinase
MRISVSDTGVGLPSGFDVAQTVGVGLKNTNEYLITKFGQHYRLRFENITPHGTKVWFNIPLHDD